MKQKEKIHLVDIVQLQRNAPITQRWFANLPCVLVRILIQFTGTELIAVISHLYNIFNHSSLKNI